MGRLHEVALFGRLRRRRRAARRRRRLQLHFYDELANQDETIRLTVRPNEPAAPPDDDLGLIPPLEETLRALAERGDLVGHVGAVIVDARGYSTIYLDCTIFYLVVYGDGSRAGGGLGGRVGGGLGGERRRARLAARRGDPAATRRGGPRRPMKRPRGEPRGLILRGGVPARWPEAKRRRWGGSAAGSRPYDGIICARAPRARRRTSAHAGAAR